MPNPEVGGSAAPASPERSTAPGAVVVTALGTTMIAVFVLLVYLLARTWPAAPDCSQAWCRQVYVFGSSFEVDGEVRLILVALVAGSIGSFIHQATSFADFVGNERLGRSWIWWYVLRVPVGGALAVVFYLLLRGGFVGPREPSVHGVAGFAALAGLFSRQATDKAREVFEVLFHSNVNAERTHKLDGTAESASGGAMQGGGEGI